MTSLRPPVSHPAWYESTPDEPEPRHPRLDAIAEFFGSRRVNEDGKTGGRAKEIRIPDLLHAMHLDFV
jgi:hypothetical protein